MNKQSQSNYDKFIVKSGDAYKPAPIELEYSGKNNECDEHKSDIELINEKINFSFTDEKFLSAYFCNIDRDNEVEVSKHTKLIDTLKKLDSACMSKFVFLISNYVVNSIRVCDKCKRELNKSLFSGKRKSCKECAPTRARSESPAITKQPPVLKSELNNIKFSVSKFGNLGANTTKLNNNSPIKEPYFIKEDGEEDEEDDENDDGKETPFKQHKNPAVASNQTTSSKKK